MTDFQLDQTGQEIKENLNYVKEKKDIFTSAITNGGIGYNSVITVDAAETIEFEEDTYRSGFYYYEANLSTTYLQGLKALLNENHIGEAVTLIIDDTSYNTSIEYDDYYDEYDLYDSDHYWVYLAANNDYYEIRIWNPEGTQISTLEHSVGVTKENISQIDSKYISEDGYGYIGNNSKKEFTITWDGDTTGKSSHSVNNMTLYKVSDTVYSADDILGCTGAGYLAGTAFSSKATTDNVTYDSHGGVILYSVSGSNMPICIFSDGSYIYSSTTFEAGVWFFKGSDTYMVSELTSIHMIDSKYLPESAGLPTGTAAGNALIFDGDEWTQQDGYGYDVTSNLIKDESVTYSSSNQAICTNTTLATFMTDTDNIGKSMSVTVDNTTYDCIVQVDDDTDLYIGNMHIWASRYEDTGEPFCIIAIGSETTRMVWEESISATKTFTINEIDRHTIDNKYIENADIVEKAVESAGIGYGKSIKLNTVNIGTSVTVNYTSGSEAFTLYKIGTIADVEDALGINPTEDQEYLGVDLNYWEDPLYCDTKMYSTEYTYSYGVYFSAFLKRNSSEHVLAIVNDNSSAVTIDSRFQAITFPSTGVWSTYRSFAEVL